MPQFAVGFFFFFFFFPVPALPEQSQTVLNVTPPSSGQQVQLVRGYMGTVTDIVIFRTL